MPSTLRRKLLLLILLSIGGTLLSVGMALSLLVNHTYKEDAHRAFADYFERTAAALDRARGAIGRRSDALAGRVRLVNALHLVSHYADAADYQAIVFDEEKKTLARLLLNQVHASGDQLIAVFDSNGWLTAFADGTRQQLGILSFRDGKPVLMISDAAAETFHPMPPSVAGMPIRYDRSSLGVQLVADAGQIGLRAASRVRSVRPDGTRADVGFLVVRRHLDADFLASAAGRFPGGYFMQTAQGERLLPSGQDLPELRMLDAADLIAPGAKPKAQWLESPQHLIQAHAVTTGTDQSLLLVASLDRRYVEQQVRNTLAVIAGVFALAALLLLPAALWFARRSITRPIDLLVGNADAIREGRYLLPVNAMGSRELDTLATALKTAAARVADRERELLATQDQLEERVAQRAAALQQTNALMQQEIAERQRTQLELLDAKQNAEQANRAKSQFLSRMSHELRTPLNAILGYAQLLEVDAGSALKERERDSVQEIRRAGEHLLELISEILDLSRIEVGSLQLECQAVDIGELARDSLSFTRGLADARGIRVVFEGCHCHSPRVHADPVRLRQVLINLISNAIKYNRDNGRVTLSCHNNGDTVRFEISDTGIGIAPDRLHRVFEPFDRLDADKLGIDGTGIGLVIVRELVTLMGGEIGLNSVPGQGTTFWFTLPLLPLVSDGDAAVPVSQASGDPRDDRRPADTGHDKPIDVLYVEDNPANYRLMERALQRRPRLRLHHALSAPEGIAMARQLRPRLILMDIQLPGMDGNQALGQLRADPDTADIPVIALSANAMADDVRHSLSLGFAAYLTKPLDLAQLYRTVDGQLDGVGQTA